MSDIGRTILDDGEKLIESHTTWYVIAGIVGLAILAYVFSKQSGTSSSGGGSFGGTGGGTGTTTSTPVDTYAQQVQDQLTLLHGTNAENQQNASFLQTLQEELASFTAGLTNQQNAESLKNYEEKATFDNTNQVSLATALGNAQVHLLESTNAANEQHTSALNAIANSQTVAAAEAQIKAQSEQFDYLFGNSGTVNSGTSAVTQNTAPTGAPLSETAFNNLKKWGLFPGKTYADVQPSTNAMPNSFSGTRFGTIFNADQLQQKSSESLQEKYNDSQIRDQTNLAFGLAGAERKLKGSDTFAAQLGGIINDVASGFNIFKGGGSGSLFTQIFGNHNVVSTPPIIAPNNGGKTGTGNNTNFTGFISDIIDPTGGYTGWYGNNA